MFFGSVLSYYPHESKSKIIPHYGCPYLAANMVRYWFEYGSEIGRIVIGGETGQDIHIAAKRHAAFLPKLDRMDRSCPVLNVPQRHGSDSTHKG